MMDGVNIRVGSLEETFAVRRFESSKRVEWLKALAIDSAIFKAAEYIAAAVSGAGGSPSMDKHMATLEALRSELMPWAVTAPDKEDKLEKARKIMEEQSAMGPLQVTSMERNRKGTSAGLY